MTNKERIHTRRVLRVLEDAVEKLMYLASAAIDNDTFPKTTSKALYEATEVLNKARTRILTGNARII